MNSIIIWNRVSSVDQKDNTSLEIQEQTCRHYLNSKNQTPTIVLNIVGSGYKPNNTLKSYYDFISKQKKALVVCFSVDRFSRNQSLGRDVYTKIKQNGGNMFFIIDQIDTSVNEELFYEKLHLSELHSIEMGKKMSRMYSVNLYNKMNENESYKTLYPFIKSIVDGDYVETINKNLVNIVDWKKHKDWKKVWGKNPVFFDESTTVIKNKKIYFPGSDFNNATKLLNSFEVEVKGDEVKNKKWTEKMVETIYKLYENKNYKQKTK